MGSDSPAQHDIEGQQDHGASDSPAPVTSDQPTQPATPEAERPAATPTATPAAGEGATEGRSRKKSTARKTRTVALTLTVTGTEDGDWQADLVHGTTRVVRGLAVPAAAVARAAKELHPEISEGIETVLSAAREQHRARMEQLEAELERVKQALAELGE
ncbi:hypothetical protein LX15_004401 [Streptoalloteichus tenebrarius]|uniref:Uncharacterized protein n=1 Tax=Streptoalloteichus tenebrarius (strain ATCC 17920 / DSM 40477 / JCM 4838 / CBS 697.72 / NBRC 16177 / NCIMB 11028 / NRRL B-12390 / A12253. 1 / ISP 5477) TaxID=1933 RepID=A0ABT1HYS8_STRSD|nr:DUF6319 family protein [Streptoalloteichus tenebrarius]MCP2260681.1 hypothetical protein [Streptoalloteichus tenebrarius]BFF03787.1 hypothetical protein GCM10020241_54620 [Streptoalloteichus tenebrarius]